MTALGSLKLKKINKKKKEIANFKKQKHVQELKERTKRNEKIVSALEEKIGVGISDEMINQFVEFQKMNSEKQEEENSDIKESDSEIVKSENGNIGNDNSEIEKYQNENYNTDKTDSY